MRRWKRALICAGMACALSGCRHKVTVPPLPQILTPVELVDIPEQQLPSLEPPQIKIPPVPIAAAAAHPRRERKRVTAKVAPAVPAQPAAEESSEKEEAEAIGSLSSGGDTSPHSQQEAADMIASNEKRLSGISAQIAEEQKTQISKVRNFQKQAQDALTSGDVEGAKTLATKAKLLLDDMEK
jgi:ribosomal protein S20